MASEKTELDQIRERLKRLVPLAKSLSTTVYRSSTPRYANELELLTGQGSSHHGGRWNPVGIPAVYASLTPETSLAETLAHFRHFRIPVEDAMPRIFVAIRVELHAILDIQDGDVRRRLQVSLERLRTVDWRADQRRGRMPVSQAIGQAAFELGLEGLLVPSASDHGGSNLMAFPSNLVSGSTLELLNADRLSH
ncbi:MAG: RES family NAD+ phosphorylase [Pirellulaceae bacterium]|nr:RES family NAD+ phosphorylase [Pirellulaceae bacterium]